MTDRTRYDRTEEEAPLVPFIGTAGRERPTTDRPTIDRRTTDRRTTDDRRTATRTTSDRPRTTLDPELKRELRTLRTQLDRIEATLKDDR
jgi:hypothetical protein